jgi:hypothetical protein
VYSVSHRDDEAPRPPGRVGIRAETTTFLGCLDDAVQSGGVSLVAWTAYERKSRKKDGCSSWRGQQDFRTPIAFATGVAEKTKTRKLAHE